jgi:Na+/glutamate symporter
MSSAGFEMRVVAAVPTPPAGGMLLRVLVVCVEEVLCSADTFELPIPVMLMNAFLGRLSVLGITERPQPLSREQEPQK